MAIPKEILDSITEPILGEIKEIEPGRYFWEDRDHIWKDGQEFRVMHMVSPKCISRILKPVLTPEEYERRRAKLEEACARLFRSMEDRKAREAAKGVAKGEEAC